MSSGGVIVVVVWGRGAPSVSVTLLADQSVPGYVWHLHPTSVNPDVHYKPVVRLTTGRVRSSASAFCFLVLVFVYSIYTHPL